MMMLTLIIFSSHIMVKSAVINYKLSSREWRKQSGNIRSDNTNRRKDWEESHCIYLYNAVVYFFVVESNIPSLFSRPKSYNILIMSYFRCTFHENHIHQNDHTCQFIHQFVNFCLLSPCGGCKSALLVINKTVSEVGRQTSIYGSTAGEKIRRLFFGVHLSPFRTQ